ncbi:myo-inositol 2-dehydrogenase [Neorhizobium sp. R1-B]|jgi:myo-inositol 2-dehydrogenase/D-chiro-inositol 1-dehydrogenase|uniref:inositol 2-dehydrogenase n=1 Tax=Neorhizobium TaxID=1525371 RepID=UPI000CF8E601|nr:MULTISPECIES: inositol 2-dehydrogenase [Neorhizobium]TCV58817.1 myo-inositol 2-dehydrogenase [Neorhizobium sp. S3-V5DH]TDX70201.1 myo-inositol 2-dehydrogenase [Neorhizobium sp. R1-B]
MIRFGVIGAGRIGKVHAATIAANPKAKLAYVADAFKDSADALAAQTGAEVLGAEDVISSANVDAVLIATPTPSHADLIEAASRAGKAILCEKPVSLSVERINACLDVVERNNSTLMIGFNRRFDPNFANVEARLRRGDIGEIEIVTITSRDPAPPPPEYVKSSGGLFRDMMIHDFDMARFLMGEEFVVVNALGSSLVDKAIGAEGDVDTAAVQMQTASGRIAVITNSRRATYGYDQRIEVHGATGMLAAKNIQATSVELSNASGISGDPVQYFFLERYAQAYAHEINAFIEAIDRGDRSPRPSGLDGLQAQKLAEAATLSWQTRRPVTVD